MIIFLFSMAVLAAILAAACAIVFPRQCKALEYHLMSPRPDYREDRPGFLAWRNRKWAMDKVRTRIGLIGIVCYGVGMGCLIPVQSWVKAAAPESLAISPTAVMVTMGVLSVSLLVVGMRAMIHNHRDTDISLRREFQDR